MYIVIFNVDSRDIETMKNIHGFLEEFISKELAEKCAKEWIDGTQYRNYQIYKQEKN